VRFTLSLVFIATFTGSITGTTAKGQDKADLRTSCNDCGQHTCTCSQGMKCCLCAAGEMVVPPPALPPDPALHDQYLYLKVHKGEIIADLLVDTATTMIGARLPGTGMAIDAVWAAANAYRDSMNKTAERYRATQAALSAFVANLGVNLSVSKLDIPDPIAEPIATRAEDKLKETLDTLPQEAIRTPTKDGNDVMRPDTVQRLMQPNEATKLCRDQYNEAIATIARDEADDVAQVVANRSTYDRGSNDTSGSDLAIKSIKEEASDARKKAQEQYDECLSER